MNAYQKLNEVIAYIEENIADEIDYKKASKIAACPMNQFQRYFVFMTNISLSEYIRKRRLTLSAIDIREKRAKIIDIAIKYRYESHSSFSRAFRDFHKITPSQAGKKEAKINIFPRLVIPEIKINLEGVIEMNDKRTFQTVEGISYRFDVLELPQSLKFVGLPAKRYSDKVREKFQNEYVSLIDDKFEPYFEIGLWENMTANDGKHNWVYGTLVNSLVNIPEGLLGIDTGWTKILVMTVKYDTMDELFNKIKKTHYSFGELIPPEYAEQTSPPHTHLPNPGGFGTPNHVKPGNFSLMEIYPHDLFEKIEMCFYIPLKN